MANYCNLLLLQLLLTVIRQIVGVFFTFLSPSSVSKALDFHEIWGIGRLWTGEELIKLGTDKP